MIAITKQRVGEGGNCNNNEKYYLYMTVNGNLFAALSYFVRRRMINFDFLKGGKISLADARILYKIMTGN